MFLFSKKLLYLLVIVALVFGEDVPQDLETCVQCGEAEPYICDGSNSKSVECSGSGSACGAKLTNGKISLFCDRNGPNWQDSSSNPKCTNGVECWCNIKNDCNAEKGFGGLKETEIDKITGTGGGGGGVPGVPPGDKLTGGGAVVTIISPGLAALLFGFLTLVTRY